MNNFGNRYMDNVKRQAFKNAARVARRLQSGEELTAEEVMERTQEASAAPKGPRKRSSDPR